MEDYTKTIYAPAVIEFVTVAKEYCAFVSGSTDFSRADFIGKLQKLIPLLYLKGSLLPYVDGNEDGAIEDTVTEDEYNTLFSLVKEKMGEYDEYLEIFDDAESYRDEPVVQTVSEKAADIYQDLKNFLNSYRTGVEAVMEEALWNLNNAFELYWGKACAEVLRAVHQAACRIKSAYDE